MLLIRKTAPNRIEIELSAPLDSVMMEAGLDDLIEKSEGIENGVILYRITSFSMPTFGAFVTEMEKLPQLMHLLGKFEKCAVLTDQGWLKAAAVVEGALLPGLQIKAFDLAEHTAAEAWLAGNDDEDPEDGFDNMPV